MTEAIPAWAVPGAKVVSLNDDWCEYVTFQMCKGPKNLEMVTITGHAYFEGHLQFVLKEYPTPLDGGFKAAYFRPAVEPKSEAHDVAMFTELAKTCTIVERLDRLAESLNA